VARPRTSPRGADTARRGCPRPRTALRARIVGVGLDITEVERIRRALDDPRTGRRFRARVFSTGEQAYCEARRRAKYESYAARFAAKEATMKALGTGWGRGVRWLDVEIVRRGSGPPAVRLHGRGRQRAAAAGVRRFVVSLAHTGAYAVAQVIAEG
jgi:holo-[acyl-carrier protein] synthase